MRAAVCMVTLALGLALLAPAPATAQSRWDLHVATFIGLVEDGHLFTIAPSTFQGCESGTPIVWLEGMSNLELWTVVAIDDAEAETTRIHWVSTPFGAMNITFEMDAWTRVFPLDGGDLDLLQTNPCDFYRNHRFIAEGPTRFNYHSADDALTGPGVNSWGFTLQGTLINSGACPGGTSPQLFWNQKWVVKSLTDYTAARSTASRGPTLVCR